MEKDKLRENVQIQEDSSWCNFIYKDCMERGDFKFLEKNLYIKKGEYKDLENKTRNERWMNSYVVKFNLSFIDREFIDAIYDHHINLVAKNECDTFADALDKTFTYFANAFSKEFKNKILGDIGEAFFILKTYEFSKNNIIGNIHSIDESLYDFSFKSGRFIEIKSTSLDKNEVILSNCQADYIKNKNFVIVKYKVLEVGTSILDLYERIKNEIGTLNDKLRENYEFYKDIKNEIKKFCINMDKTTIGVLSDECIPSYSIDNVTAVKKVKFYIDVTDNLNDFQTFIKNFEFDN